MAPVALYLLLLMLCRPAAPHPARGLLSECKSGTRRCGSRCVSLTDPAACGPACTRCPRPAANGAATCSKTGVCGVSCAKGYQRVMRSGAAKPACRVCPANTTKADAGAGPCLPCPAGTQTLGNKAQDHDESKDCVPGGLLGATSSVGSPAEALAAFEFQWGRSLNNSGGRGGGRGGSGGRSKACLYACDGMEMDTQFSINVAHLAGSPSVYHSSNASHVRNGVNLVSSVRDQLRCGTCVSHALASAAESSVAAALRVDASSLNISHYFAYFCSPFYSPEAGPIRSCSTGWSYDEALHGMSAFPAAFFMNSSCLDADVDPSTAQLPDAQLRQWCLSVRSRKCLEARITCQSRAVSDGLAHIQRSIRQYGSVVSRIRITAGLMGFFRDNPAGVFNGSDRGSDENSFLHAVQLIGYDNDPEDGSPPHFLAKNSFGEQWGDKGFFRIAYSVADVGFPEDTYSLINCRSERPEEAAAWRDAWPITRDPDDPEEKCFLYEASERDSISGIVDHFQVDILQFVEANTRRGVIPTIMMGNPPRPEPQLQPPATTWAGVVFQVCNIPDGWFQHVATDPCLDIPNYCNGRATSCVAGRCTCPERYAGEFCEHDIGILRNFSLSGQLYVLHMEELSWPEAQQRCERSGMRLARLWSHLHACEVNRKMAAEHGHQSYWIGLNDRKQEGTFVWVGADGADDSLAVPTEFAAWSVYYGPQPDDSRGIEECVLVWGSIDRERYGSSFGGWMSGAWNDRECSALNRFLCGPAAETSDPCVKWPCSTTGMSEPIGCESTAGSSGGSSSSRHCVCAAGFAYVSDELGCVRPFVRNIAEFQLSGVRHALYTFPLATWTEAERVCNEAGMALAKIETNKHAGQLTAAVVEKLKGQNMAGAAWWIGLNDRAREGSFAWSGFAELNTTQRWMQDQPTNNCHWTYTATGSCADEGEDCVVMDDSGQWQARRCWEKNTFVCVALP